MAVFWLNTANSSSFTVSGVTVDSGGSAATVGITDSGRIKYYIPLDEDLTGVYGVTSPAHVCDYVGECHDHGDGVGYDDASALDMNIFFNLAGLPQSESAQLDFVFDDLDLTDINDPNGFFESMSLSYWDGADYQLIDGVIKNSSHMSGTVNIDSVDPITWNLDLAALGILGDLNDSNTNDNGFWIQLGFGSDYYTRGKNTAEYLTAALTVSPVPVPAAIWLFGTALIGFVGMSRRTKVG
jgi:hypothetical protein